MKSLARLIICLLLGLLTSPSVFSNHLKWENLLSYDIKNTGDVERAGSIAFIANTSGKNYSLQMVYVDDSNVYFVGTYEPGWQRPGARVSIDKLDSVTAVKDIKIITDSMGCPLVAFMSRTVFGKSLVYVSLSGETNQWQSPQNLSEYNSINALFLCPGDQIRGILTGNNRNYSCCNFTTGEVKKNFKLGGRICDVLSDKKYYYASTFTKSPSKEGKYKFGKYNADWTPCKRFKPIVVDLSFNAAWDRSCSKFRLGEDGRIIPYVVWSNYEGQEIRAILGEGQSNSELVAKVDMDNPINLSLDVLWPPSGSKISGIPFIAYIDGRAEDKKTLKCAFKSPKDGTWQTDTVVATGVQRDSVSTVVYNNKVYIAYCCNNKLVISYADVSKLEPLEKL